MFGTFRLILACLVALSHFGLVVQGFNPGQWAVVSFYVLSGYLMQGQVKKLGTTRLFYLDRFLRIFPLYVLVVLFAAWVERASPSLIATNLCLFPLDYPEFTGIPMIIGPAWSVACECHYYALAPYFARTSLRPIHAVMIASLAVFVAAPFSPHSAWWAYTGLPGIIFTFLSGALLRRKEAQFVKYIWFFLIPVLMFCACSKVRHWDLKTGININVCIGYLLAIPLMRWLSSLPQVKWDQRLGLLSYPLFLIHEPINDLAVKMGFHLSMPLKLVLSLVAATVLVVAVEMPLERVRYRIRGKEPRKKT